MEDPANPSLPRLTIAIPTVNRAAMVGRAIESALAQTYPNIEIIVSNNGSSDNTRNVLDRYRGSQRLIINDLANTIPANNHGNLLLGKASGDLFLLLSDDDWLEPAFADRVISHFERYPEVSFVWTGCFMYYGAVATVCPTGPPVERGTDFFAAFLAGRRGPCWCAIVTRTDELRRIGPIPTDVICGDMFYWTKLATTGTVGCVAAPLSHYVCYRDGGDGIAGGAPVPKWAYEMRAWTDDMVASCETVLGNPAYTDLRRIGKQFVARATANQFVWKALRGSSRSSLFKSLGTTLPLLRGGKVSAWLRVLAALLAPRKLLRSLLLTKARMMASDAARWPPDTSRR